MRRVVGIAAALAAVALGGGCGVELFQDVGTDPHPPEIALVALAFQPVEDADGNTPPPVLLPPTGITVRPNDSSARTILLRVSYRDAGADIVTFAVRDRDSLLSVSVTPQPPDDDSAAPSFFLGVSGQADLEGTEIAAGMAGDHRFEVWAEDSHGSRSAKVSFTVTVEL